LRNFPALPTKGFPVLSSSLPGFCPTIMSFAFCGPSPGTACCALSQSRHFRQLHICLFNSLSGKKKRSPLWLRHDSHTTLKALHIKYLEWIWQDSGGYLIPSLINPRTINFFFNLALAFEPLAPSAINYYLSRTLKEIKQQGYILNYKVKTKRIHKFHYRIWLDLDLTATQTHYVLGHLLPRRIKFLRRWFNV